MKNLKLTWTALITPFKNGNIDWSSLQKLVQQQVQGGIDGFVVNGTTAESPNLSEDEVEKLFLQIRQWLGKDFPLMLGTGSNSTQKTIETTLKAQKLGADAALVVVPYYNKPPQRGLFEHFKAVANKTDLPIVLYNVPSRTITSLEYETILALSEIKNIVGVKEASADMGLLHKLKKNTPTDFVLLSGDDGSYVEFLKNGGHGVISVSSHIIPSAMVNWKKWIQAGEPIKAEEDLQKYKELIDLLFIEANPIPLKKALQLMGIIDSAELRLPLVELPTEKTMTMKKVLQAKGLL